MTTRKAMWRKVIGRSITARPGRTAIAFSALTLAAALITTMLALYGDLERKLDREFRTYGANIVVASTSDRPLPEDAEARARLVVGDAQLVPTAVAVVTAGKRGGGNTSVVVVGADLERLRSLNRWWKITGEGEGILAGKRAAQQLDAHVPLRFSGRALAWAPGQIIESGGQDDDRLFIPLPQFEAWTGTRPNALEVSYTGSATETERVVERLRGVFAPEGAEVRPVRRIVAAEGRVIRKTRSMMFACGLLIALTVGVCVASTLTASVLERRRDFALMKALGASQGAISGIFAAESALLGAVSAMVGFVLGAGVADLIGHINFHSSIVPTVFVFPLVVVATAGLALAAAALPMLRLQSLQPAVILKGE